MKWILIAIGLIVAGALAWYFMRGQRSSPVKLASTYEGQIDQYHGGKTLLVAVHAQWAPVSRATMEALAKVDPVLYDIKLIDADTEPQAVRDLGVDIVPTVIVYKDGKQIAKLPNMMSPAQLP